MKNRSYLIILFFYCLQGNLFAQTSNDTWAVKFSNGIIYRYQPTVNALTSKGWEYSNTIITHGIEKVYNNVTDSAKYLNYIKTYVDAYVNSSGVISPTITLSTASLDKTHPGISCLFLYEKTGLVKYKTAATFLRNFFVGASATYPKTAKGNIFWHKNNGSYNDIILIDGIYMLHPFLAKYGVMFNDNAAIDTAVNQTLYIYNQLYDNSRHLIRHAWNPTNTQAWADPVTGNSSEVWSRGMGWFTMALVDILKYIPSTHPRRSELLTALSNLAIGIQTYQDPTTGLWYQVVDKGTTLSNNYLETSGSAMFVYALKTAVDSSWINYSYLAVAQKAWNYFKDVSHAKISIYSTDGYPKINDFAPAMSVQTSAANYVQASLQPVDVPGTAHPHGYAAILMAASVMEFPILMILPVNSLNISATNYNNRVNLFWTTAGDTQLDHYAVEKSADGTNFTLAGTVKSTEATKYKWVDTDINESNSYYRIKSVSLNGDTRYSSIILVKSQPGIHAATSVEIAPNPVANNSINISMHKLNPGVYKLNIASAQGVVVFTKQIEVTGISSIYQSLTIPVLTKGTYYLTVTGKGFKTTRQVFIY